VWLDKNRNGLQDDGEPGVPGVPVVLRSGDTEVAKTTTGADGKYLFDNLPDGTYRVCFLTDLPAQLRDYTLTKPKAGNDTTDSDPDPQTGCTKQVTVGPGQREILTLDAGLVAPPKSTTYPNDGNWLASTGYRLGWWWPLLGALAIALGTLALIAARRRERN
jgi:SdrD B-like domain